MSCEVHTQNRRLEQGKWPLWQSVLQRLPETHLSTVCCRCCSGGIQEFSQNNYPQYWLDVGNDSSLQVGSRCAGARSCAANVPAGTSAPIRSALCLPPLVHGGQGWWRVALNMLHQFMRPSLQTAAPGGGPDGMGWDVEDWRLGERAAGWQPTVDALLLLCASLVAGCHHAAKARDWPSWWNVNPILPPPSSGLQTCGLVGGVVLKSVV